MASAAESSGSNGVTVEAGDLTAEDAERFASEFKPSWEFDEAPFSASTAAADLNEDLHALGTGGVNDEVAAALKTEMARAAGIRPTTTLVMQRPSNPAPPMDQPQQQPRLDALAPDQNVGGNQGGIQVAPARSARPPAQIGRSESPRAVVGDRTQRSRADSSSAIQVPIKRSNKGILFAAIGVVGGLGLIFGIRAVTSSSTPDPATTPVTQTAAPTHDEPRIPAPVPASDIPAPAAADPVAPVSTAASAAGADRAPVPAPRDPPRDPPRAAPDRQPRPVAAPPVARILDRPARPPVAPAPPKAAAPKAPGGIVRDNPF